MKRENIVMLLVTPFIIGALAFVYIKNYTNLEDADIKINTPPVATSTQDANPAKSTTTSTTSISTSTTYSNSEYGFSLVLPKSWSGYSVSNVAIQYGNKVTLRSPLWTEQNPRMDIPVLVYPIAQWKVWEKNNFEGYPTAAPIGPTERGRNTEYVFSTAPRYNFSYLTGFEEVDIIVSTLKGF